MRKPERYALDLNEDDRALILGALETLSFLLAGYQHEWDEGEKAIYEAACDLLGGDTGGKFERIDDAGEEWKE